MKIYIPEHLKKIKLIRDLCKMISEYSEHYYSDNSSSFNDYYYYLKKDPIQKFLSLCITKDNIAEGQDLEEVIKYISRLFYSVKGTSKVFDYMKKYLGLSISGNIIHNSNYIEITLTSVNLNDEGGFVDAFRDFLEALLYFRELNIVIPEVNLQLKGNIDSEFGGEAVVYKVFVSGILDI